MSIYDPRMRFNYVRKTPDGYAAMVRLEKALHDSGLEPSLMHLIRLRCSQLNHCAYCIDLHWKDLRALGQSEERLYMLDAWRESALYSGRERAALLWAETLTNIQGGVSDEIYEQVAKQFDEIGMANLSYVVAAINAWNRLAISGKAPPGRYVSKLVPGGG